MSTTQVVVDLDTLKGLEPIASLSHARIEELAKKTIVEGYAPGTALFSEGEYDRCLVYLLDGEIELRSELKPEPLYITAGMPESWRPLANRQPRQMTATAVGYVEVIRIDIDEFDRLLAWDQMAASDDGQDSQAKRSAQNAAGKMTQSATFANLPAANIEALFRRMETLAVKTGDVIIRQGDPGDYYYILDRGQVRVTRQMEPNGPVIELAVLGTGASFGEEALISDNPRNASITMLEDGQVRRLAKKDFIELLKEPMLDWVELGEAVEALENDAQFLDVRVASEFQQGHLPSAIDIPLFELRQRIGELDGNVKYICYCSTGRRSSAAAFLLAQNGLKAAVLKGGIDAVPPSFVIR
ncbi:MAG: cyclic nucleotide-binding domain-containing protein [Pseudomonadota bacterium]